MQRHMPLGYRIVDGRAETVPEEAEIVKTVFQEYLNGVSTYRIAKSLTEQGVLNASHKPSWNHATVGKMLENAKYMGDDFHPPLIDRTRFEQVRCKRREKAESLGRTAQPNSFANRTLFGGWLYCGACGEPYRRYVEHGGQTGETIKWKCRHYIWKNRVCCRNIFLTDEQIESAFIRIINRVIKTPALLEGNAPLKAPASSPASERLTRQIEQALQSGTYTADGIRRMAFERAAGQYQAAVINDWQYRTDKLKAALVGTEAQLTFDKHLFIETMKKVFIYEDGRLQFILQNGRTQETNIQEKEEVDA